MIACRQTDLCSLAGVSVLCWGVLNGWFAKILVCLIIGRVVLVLPLFNDKQVDSNMFRINGLPLYVLLGTLMQAIPWRNLG